MKFILISDLHLDASFGSHGLPAQVGRTLRHSLQQTLLNVVELVKTTRADALLCGGDLYEHDRFSPETAAFLRYAFAQLEPIPVHIAPGNHDWYGPQSVYRQVEWTSNVHIFSSNRLSPFTISDGFTLWGAAHCAPAGTENFLEGFRVDRAGVNVGLFHGSEMSWLAAQGANKFPHAPFRAEEIERVGLNHLFVGHYHRRRSDKRFTYPGNPHPLSFGEEGNRGAVIVTIFDDGTVQREWRSVANFLFHDVQVNITGCISREDIKDRIRQGITSLHGIARVTLHGDVASELDFHPNDFIDVSHSMEALLVRVGELHPSFDLEAIAKESTVRGQFVRDVLEAEMSEDKRNRVLTTGLRALEGRRDLEVF
jgi:DNA repair exonuclease SbcCD nuclease subunit